MKALEDIRVLSFAQLAQGPSAVQYMADLGADVLKIERPEVGAWERSWSGLDIFINGESAFFLSLNRNQRSSTLNLKSDAGRDILLKLVETADVVVENFRPNVMERLGIGYEALREVNGRLIYASASGYGGSGPYVAKPGQDLLAQCVGGLASVSGPATGPPIPVGAAVVDVHSSALLTIGILAALHARQQTGKGQKVEVNLLEAAVDMQKEALFYYANNNGPKPFERSNSGIGGPFYEAPHGIYETQDGYVAISVTDLKKLGNILDLPDLTDAEHPLDGFYDRDTIKPLVQKRTATLTTEDLLEKLEAHDVWCAKVNDYRAVLDDPQLKHNKTFINMQREDLGEFTGIACPIHLSETPARIDAPPPKLGEHTRDVLTELGLTDTEIESAKRDGTV